MDTQHPDPGGSADPDARLPHCRQAKRTLVRLASQLRRPPVGGVASALDEEATLDLTWLHGHVSTCARCAERLGRRLRAVEARVSLRQRSVPEAIFADFYEGVRDRAGLVPPGGAMSPAFLDAPRALHVWRSTALAATVLFAVGLGILWTREPAPGGVPGGLARPLADPRSELLPAAWTERGPARRADALKLRLRPMPGVRSRGHSEFYGNGSALRSSPTTVPASEEHPKPRWD